MGKGLASLIAVLGAGMGGYAKGNQTFLDNERNAKRDAREEEEYQYTRDQRGKAQALEQGIADAQKDVTPEIITDTGATYPDQELVDADNRERTRMMEATGQSAPAPMKAAAYKVGDQTHADMAGARMALNGVNSDSEKNKRTAQFLRSKGQVEQAAKFDALAKSALAEGTDGVLAAIQGASPAADALKKAGGMIASTVGAEAADLFNTRGGKWKVTAETPVQYFLDKDPAGREFVNARVMGKNGQPLIDDVHTATRFLMDAKDRFALDNDNNRTYLAAQGQAEQSRHNQATEKSTDRHQRVIENNSAATLTLARARENREASDWKRQTLEGQIAQIEHFNGPLSPEQKKAFVNAKLGIKSAKDGATIDAKMIDDVTKDWAKQPDANGDKPAPEAIAKFRANLTRSMGAYQANEKIEGALREDFAGKKPGTPEYAATYAEAAAHVPADALAKMGFPAPTAPAPVRAGVMPVPTAQPGARPAPAPAPAPASGNAQRNAQTYARAMAGMPAMQQQVAQLEAQLAKTPAGSAQFPVASALQRAKVALSEAQEYAGRFAPQ